MFTVPDSRQLLSRRDPGPFHLVFPTGDEVGLKCRPPCYLVVAKGALVLMVQDPGCFGLPRPYWLIMADGLLHACQGGMQTTVPAPARPVLDDESLARITAARMRQVVGRPLPPWPPASDADEPAVVEVESSLTPGAFPFAIPLPCLVWYAPPDSPSPGETLGDVCICSLDADHARHVRRGFEFLREGQVIERLPC